MSGRYGCTEDGYSFATLDDLAEHDHATHGEPARYVLDGVPFDAEDLDWIADSLIRCGVLGTTLAKVEAMNGGHIEGGDR